MYQISNEKFGLFVTELRKEKNLTQKDLAEKLYVSDKTVSKWERGLSMPNVVLLIFEGGWCDEVPEEKEYLVSKTVILTEGSTDARVISEAMKLLYPHMVKFYSFIDFQLMLCREVQIT